MQMLTILHKGWRANDTLIEREDETCVLTYYTHKKQDYITSDRVGVMLYKNTRVFQDRQQAMLWYVLYEPKRYQKRSK